MNLIRHELYKIFSKKMIYFVLLFFIALNIIYSLTKEPHFDRGISDEYKIYQGKVTEKKYKLADESFIKLTAAKPKYQDLSNEDKQRYNLYLLVMEKWDEYQRKKAEIKKNTETINNNKNISKFDINSLKLKNSLMGEIKPYDIVVLRGYDKIINYINRYGMTFLAALILLGLSSVFCSEYNSNMDSIILSSKYGRNKLIHAKIIASIIYVTVMALILSLSNLILNYFRIYDQSGWNSVIQNLVEYSNSPYGFNFIQFYIIELLIHIFGGIVFALLVLAISTKSKNVLIPFFISGSIFFIPLLLQYMFGPITEVTYTFFSFNDIMKVDTLFSKYLVFDIWGQPVLYPILIMIVYAFIGILLTYFIYRSFKNHEIAN